MNPECINAARELSVIRVTEKRIERLDTIAAVTDRMAQLSFSDRSIWMWIANETHAAAEDLRELHRLHQAMENADQGGGDDATT